MLSTKYNMRTESLCIKTRLTNIKQLYSSLLVIPRHLHFYAKVSEQSPIFIGRFVHMKYEAGTECSETSAHKIQPPESHPKERI